MRKCLVLLPMLLLAGPALADPPPAKRIDVERRAEAMFDKSDANHDGILTRDEYHAALAAIVKAKGGTPTAKGRIPRGNFVAAALAHFDGADLNHDGTVTPGEARKAASIKRKVMKAQEKAAR